MSKFCMLEIEDNVWDGFGENDHLVALSGDEHTDQFAIEGGGCKERRLEFLGTGSTDLSTYDTQGVFPSCDSEACKEVKRLTSDDTSMSGHHCKSSNIDSIDSELCMDDTVLGDKCVMEDDSVCEYPINNISQADNELSFLDNDGWLDIGNFEDVDRMFRNCDSTFGMGSLNNEEEFCWLSSSNGTNGSDDVSKSTFKLSGTEPSLLQNISDNDTDSKAGTDGLPINDSNKKSSSLKKKLRTQMDVDDVVPASLSVLSESDMRSGCIDDSMPKEKRKLSKPSEGKRKYEYLENGSLPCQSPGSAQQLVHQFENENEGHSEVDGVSVGFFQETESSNVQEISSVSPVDEISLELSFRQLQLVMDQLDIRTKLCIRDSLYRLAKSAEQRHYNYAKANGSIGDNIEACKTMMPQDVSGCSGFMDMETDTNPIDRSIAHFLFHRPTDSPVMPPSEK
ncbi:hypothetical protein K1719_023210 [Acacia pycnantha]|nr:hypothetical protein K1719_023210 [Acacia pycnantha]